MEFKKQGREILNHFQSGVSYMIPLVVAAGLLTSIAVIFGGTGVCMIRIHSGESCE